MKTVHTEHCCVIHGCKYDEHNCPVAVGDTRQTFLCEWCDDTEIQMLAVKDAFENGLKPDIVPFPFYGPIPWPDTIPKKE